MDDDAGGGARAPVATELQPVPGSVPRTLRSVRRAGAAAAGLDRRRGRDDLRAARPAPVPGGVDFARLRDRLLARHVRDEVNALDDLLNHQDGREPVEEALIAREHARRALV